MLECCQSTTARPGSARRGIARRRVLVDVEQEILERLMVDIIRDLDQPPLRRLRADQELVETRWCRSRGR